MLLPLLMNLGMFTPAVQPTIPDGSYGYGVQDAAGTYVAGVPSASSDSYTAGPPDTELVYISES